MSPAPTGLKRLAAIAAWLLAPLGSLAAGVAGLFAGAALASSLPVLLGCAVAACAVAAALLFVLALRLSGRRPSWKAAAALATSSGVLFAFLFWVLLVPPPAPPQPPLADRGVAFDLVALSTGSKVAVAHLGEPLGPDAAPVVFLHGGPGSPVQAGTLSMLARLAEKGVHVVAFDQAGVGLAERLEPLAYSVDRAVADLEALRVHLGVERLVLVGGSWGARYAYEYLAAHPERVARVAFTASAPLLARDWAFDYPAALLGEGPRFAPWFVAAWALAEVNPLALLALARRDQLDAEFARLAPLTAARLYCPGRGPASPPAASGGFDGAQFIRVKLELSHREAPAPPPRPPPALVIRPECDVMPWDAARAYRDLLGATLVMVPGMGHVATAQEEDLLAELLAAFVEDRPLPLPRYDGREVPTTAKSR